MRLSIRFQPPALLANEQWQMSPIQSGGISAMRSHLNARGLSLSQLQTQILMHNQIGNTHGTTPDIPYLKEFITPTGHELHDFSTLTLPDHLKRALDRMETALKRGEKIVVNGDPDADGTPGAAVLTGALQSLGADVKYDFPIRGTEGHGLQPRIIDEAKAEGRTLIITTDCGSKDLAAVDYAKQQGIDVLISDHHIVGPVLPDAVAVVNPMTLPVKTPEQTLAGGSVAMKLMLALYERLNTPVPNKLMEAMLGMTALSTISDRMSLLTPQNRYIVKTGVNILNSTRLEGLRALMKESQNKLRRPATEGEISLNVVPLINAAGRIGDRNQGIPDSRLCVELMLMGVFETNTGKTEALLRQLTAARELDNKMKHASDAENTARDAISTVSDVNEQRKELTSKVEDELEGLIKSRNLTNDRIIILHGADMHSGVIGIDADRLKDRFKKPAILLADQADSPYVKASVRSIPSINIYEIINNVALEYKAETGHDLFEAVASSAEGEKKIIAFGGHAQALGFTIHKSLIPTFEKRVRAKVEQLPESDFVIQHKVMATVPFKDISVELVDKIRSLAPYGMHVEQPLLRVNSVKIRPGYKLFGNRYQKTRTPHVAFNIADKQNNNLPAVGFNLGEKLQKLVKNNPEAKFDLIFSVERSRKINGQGEVPRLVVTDIRLAGQV